MNNIELATVVEHELPIVTVIFNNHALGMVRQWQDLFFGGRYSHTSLKEKRTDFVKLAEAYGAAAYRAGCPEEFDAALRTAFDRRKPAVIDCEISADEKVFPMVAPGAGIDEQIFQ